MGVVLGIDEKAGNDIETILFRILGQSTDSLDSPRLALALGRRKFDVAPWRLVPSFTCAEMQAIIELGLAACGGSAYFMSADVNNDLTEADWQAMNYSEDEFMQGFSARLLRPSDRLPAFEVNEWTNLGHYIIPFSEDLLPLARKQARQAFTRVDTVGLPFDIPGLQVAATGADGARLLSFYESGCRWNLDLLTDAIGGRWVEAEITYETFLGIVEETIPIHEIPHRIRWLKHMPPSVEDDH